MAQSKNPSSKTTVQNSLTESQPSAKIASSERSKTVIQGVSLGQDAWRRLKKNRSAMISLCILLGIVLLSFLTPLLPLQTPDLKFTDFKYAAPSFAAVKIEESDRFSFKAIPKSESRRKPLEEKLALVKEKLAKAKSAYVLAEENFVTKYAKELTGLSDKEKIDFRKVTLQALNDNERAAQKEVNLTLSSIFSIVQKPYRDAGYPSMGGVARMLTRVRYHVFGDYMIPSICGRDLLGRDIFSRIFWGSRVSLIVGLVATLVSLTIGVTYGSVSGYLGGWVDSLMMRIVDILYSVPFIFVVIFLLTILNQEDMKLWMEANGFSKITVFFFVVGALFWLTMARVVRGQVISLKTEQFVEAAQSLGVSQTSIIFKHIIPNLFSVVIVYLTLTIPQVILFETFLSFLGLGIQAPEVSWGLLANEGLKVITPVKIHWWLILFPSMALGITLFALNFLGDGVRDALDPKMKGR